MKSSFMRKLLFLLCVCAFTTASWAQNTFPASGNVLIGTSTSVPSALLNVNSTTQGLLVPRLTTTQRGAITTPATGLIIYNTTTSSLDYYTGTAWVSIPSGTLTAWGLTGNSITAGSNFFGSTNNVSLRFRTNNIERMVIDSSGNFGIWNLTPTARLDIIDTTLSGSGALSGSLLNLFQKWNTTGNPSAFKINVTNTASGSTAKVFDVQLDGVSRLNVDRNGNINQSSGSIFQSFSKSSPSGTYVGTSLSGQFTPTTGTATYAALALSNVINQTGTANGISRGIQINPTLTSAVDWRSIEFTNNAGWGLYGIGTAKNYLAGALSIGTSTVDTSALVNIASTTKGVLLPRMTTVQMIAIPNPAAGLLVFNTDSASYCQYTGSIWLKITGSSGSANGGWSTTGNVVNANDFIGSNNNANLRFKTNGIERLVVDSTGNIGIGNNYPTARLDIKDTTLSGSGTSSGSALNISQKWNTSGDPVAIKANITNTSSGANSKLVDLLVDGATRFNVDKLGNSFVNGNISSGISNTANGGLNIYRAGSINAAFSFDALNGNMKAGGYIAWQPYNYLNADNTFVIAHASSGSFSWRAGAASADPTTLSQLMKLDRAGTLTLTSPALTGASATPILDLSQIWNTTGNPTAIKLNVVNTASGNSAYLMDFQVGGQSKFRVDKNGSGFFIAGLSVGGNLTSAGATIQGYNGYPQTRTDTAINVVIYNQSNTNFSPTSGSANFTNYQINNIINQTGNANGISRGLHINPVLTSAYDWRSVEFTNNTGWGIYGSGTAKNYLAGNLSIGTTTVDTSALLNIASTTKGVLLPRMTTVQMIAIPNPAAGLLVFNTDSASYVQYTGASWQKLAINNASGSSIWSLNGTNAYYNDGNIGIGTNSPTARLNIQNNSVSNSFSDASGILLENTTLATLNNPKYSPQLIFGGNDFNTTTSSSVPVKAAIGLQAINTTSSNLIAPVSFQQSVNGGPFSEFANLSPAGEGGGSILKLTNGAQFGTVSRTTWLYTTAITSGPNGITSYYGPGPISTGTNSLTGHSFGVGISISGGTNSVTNMSLGLNSQLFNSSGGTNYYNSLRIAPAINSTGGELKYEGILFDPALTANIGLTVNAWHNRKGNMVLNSMSGTTVIGDSTFDASAILHVKSTTKGSMPFPQMTTSQRDAIGSPANGLFVYNTSTNTIDYFNGSTWSNITSGGTSGGTGQWTLTGANISNTNTGSVYIGLPATNASAVDNGAYKLYVEKGIRTRKLKVDALDYVWPDNVFEDDYKLPTLHQVENFIKKNKHLEGVASADSVKKEGIDLGENQAVLLKKVEELTLYIIEQNKRTEEQQKQIADLQKQLQQLQPKKSTHKAKK